MRANFPQALFFVLRYEGHWSNDPADPGGETCYGITQRTFSMWLSANGQSNRSVRMITSMECGQIYRRDFASKIGFDTLPPGVDILAFDIAVNMGPGRALDFLSQTAKVTPNPARILELHKLRMGFWKRLAIWTRFGKGWAARETACLALALRLANA